MYYIVETRNTGPNSNDNDSIDDNRVEITTSPARMNISNEICSYGWCGTSNFFATYAHGEYETIEAARNAIIDIFGDVRPIDSREHNYSNDAVGSYKLGGFMPLGRQDTEEWIFEEMTSRVTADYSNADIRQLAAELESSANNVGMALTKVVIIIEKYRDDLLEFS